MRSVRRRSAPSSRRRPAFLYIDEAAEYFDNNFDNLLNQARKYKLGMVLARLGRGPEAGIEHEEARRLRAGAPP